MSDVKPLSPAELRRRCDPTRFAFASTAELEDLVEIVGQARAEEAVRFGIGIRRYGYNLFALGPSGMGKHGFVRRFLEQKAAQEETASDWCYVHNFQDPHRPRTLRLAPGRGVTLRQDLDRLIEELRVSVPAAFESEDYRARKKLLETKFSEQSERALADIEKRAQERGIALIRTPMGLGLAPVRNGEVIDPEEFQRLSEEERERYRVEMGRLQEQVQEAVGAIPREARKHRDALRELNREVTSFAVGHLMDDVRARWGDVPPVLDHLEAVRRDVLENADEFLGGAEDGLDPMKALLAGRPSPRSRFRRYQVNLLVDHGGEPGAPVVYEDYPTHANLMGRVEHLSEFGNLVTDFLLVNAGALHRANGGYLIVDARKLLQQPFAWDELKRALRSRQVRIESLAQALNLLATASLEPEPIPLEIKVVLVGERLLYYLLAELDPDFLELFKVAADFEETLDRNPEGEGLYARLLGSLARREGLRPLDPGGVARVIEHAARLAGDAEKLSLHVESLADLLREADYLAGRAGRQVVTAAHVQEAIDAQVRRADRLRDRVQEEIRRGTILIETGGERAGQVNGLSVIQLGRFAFGRPSRITARVRLGSGQVVDIEREVALGGPLHSKGVLILAGFLGARYAGERPLALSASLVFEQSYSGVEGDSASCAELFALLSALAEVPVRQCFAVTGSVNQHGEVQAVGGVSEKIEGFFDVCRAKGLTGQEGVLIPAANVKHLMLREDVVEAVEQGRFRVYPIETVDQGIEILTGTPAGERDLQGRFPEGTFNQRVEARLAAFAEKARAFARLEPAEKKP